MRFQLNTNTKLRLARRLYRALKVSRALLGKKEDRVICRRGGIRWDLELSEGIDLSIYALGGFERTTARTIAAHLFPGAIVLDVGANIGAHALPMARRVGPTGQVYAIEPTDWAFERLRTNLALNPALEGCLLPVQAVLTEQNAPVPERLYSSWDLFAGDSHRFHGGTLRPLIRAVVTTMDELSLELGLSRIDFVKLDVDGFECKVLRGGRNTLARFRPKMILELSPCVLEEQGDSLEALLSLLAELGYLMVSGDGKHALPPNAGRLSKMIPAGGGINALALPRS